MATPESILASIFAKILEVLRSAELREAEHAEKTARAILQAANATHSYEVWREANGWEKDVEREHRLSALWSEAALYMSRHDAELGQRLENKSNYWLSPSDWNEEDIRSARIGLGAVTNAADQLLNPKIRRGTF